MFIGVITTSIVSTCARNNTTCGLLINGFHGFLSLNFFLTALTRICTCETCSTCAIKWQCPLCNMRSFKTWVCLYIPLLLSPSPGSSSHGVFPTSLHLLCSAPVLQDLALHWGYRFIWCAGWEEHLFSLVMDSSTFLEGFCFFLSQVLTVPMLGNILSLALVFHSSTSGCILRL